MTLFVWTSSAGCVVLIFNADHVIKEFSFCLFKTYAHLLMHVQTTKLMFPIESSRGVDGKENEHAIQRVVFIYLQTRIAPSHACLIKCSPSRNMELNRPNLQMSLCSNW